MFSRTMRPGEAVEIGDAAVVRVEYKSGAAAKLSFFTHLPIRRITDGIIPPKYVYGISGPARVLEDYRQIA